MQKNRFQVVCRIQESNRCPCTILKMQIMHQKSHKAIINRHIDLLQQAPVMWLSKKHNSVETLTFGSEFTALKLAVKLVIALRYKLRIFLVTLKLPADMFCDNKSVFKNISTPESVLHKKHHSIAYHKFREAVSALICRISKEDNETNLVDLFKNILVRTRS